MILQFFVPCGYAVEIAQWLFLHSKNKNIDNYIFVSKWFCILINILSRNAYFSCCVWATYRYSCEHVLITYILRTFKIVKRICLAFSVKCFHTLGHLALACFLVVGWYIRGLFIWPLPVRIYSSQMSYFEILNMLKDLRILPPCEININIDVNMHFNRRIWILFTP